MLAIARVLACAHLGPNIHLQRAKQRRRFRPKAAELRRHILQANRGHIARGLAARALAGRDADFLVAAQGCLREIARLQGPAVAALRPGVEEAPALEVPGPLCQGRRRQAGRVVALLAPRRRLGRLAHLLASGGSVGQDLLPELQLGSGAGWGPDGATLRQSGGPAALHFQQVHVRRRPLAASGRSASRPFAGGGPKLRQHRLMQIPWHSPLQGQVSGSRRHLPQGPLGTARLLPHKARPWNPGSRRCRLRRRRPAGRARPGRQSNRQRRRSHRNKKPRPVFARCSRGTPQGCAERQPPG